MWSASPANVEQLFAIQIISGIKTVTFVPLSGDCQEVSQLFEMSYNATYTPYIDAGTNDIIFGGVSYSLEPNTNPTTDGFDPSAARSAVQTAAQTMFREALNVSLPDITTFALKICYFQIKATLTSRRSIFGVI
jgi:hypothetical protein